MRPVLILFARSPVPGRVKTRLHPRLKPDESAALHECFVRDTVEMLLTLSGEADVELHTDIPTDAWNDLPVPRFTQAPGDLGERMLQAITDGLDAGRSRVTIVGSDSPTLPPAHLRRLLAADADVTLGPVADGGYYAIGCRRAHPEMFAGVRFSRPDTLRQTAQAAEACGLTVALGDPWYDVDTPADLDRLRRSPELPRHTANFLSRLKPTR